jgi:hypothetical protein
MPDSPDFESIARHLNEEHGLERLDEWDPENSGRLLAAIAEQLRLVWNARGATDLNAIDSAVAYTKDGIVTGARHQIARALQSVDR